MKRPLLPVAVLYVSGILLAEYVSLPLLLTLCASFLLLGAALLCAKYRALLLAGLLISAGLVNATFHSTAISPHDLRQRLGTQPSLLTVRGRLLETPTPRVYELNGQPAWRTSGNLEVNALCPLKGQWQAAAGTIAVTTAGVLTNFFSGQSVEVTGVAAPPAGAVAEGMFDYRNYLRRQGIYYRLQAESQNDWRAVGSSPAPPLADRFRVWARHALGLGLPGEDESLRLEWALTLGWKTILTETVSEPFVRAATYHIFAVDGLRMAIVFGIFFSVFRVLGLPRPASGLVLLPLIWFYVALTGWPASAIRATVMLSVIILGWVLRRPCDPMNSLFAAALIILLWEPGQFFQAGFQLSFFVVLALILIIPPLFELVKRVTAPDPLLPKSLQRRWHPFFGVPARYTMDLLVTSFAAWIGSIPLVAYYFNILTPVSTPANILAVPLCVAVLISNLISLLLAGWFPAAAALFNQAGWFCMECIRVTSHWFAHWPAAYYYTAAPSLLTILLYYGLLLAFLSGWALRPAGRPWKIAGMSAAILFWAGLTCSRLPVTQLTVLPVHGGASIYCDAAGAKQDLLIDVGSSNSVQFITKPFLRSQGVNSAPPLVLTHGDLHHLGGAEPFMQAFNVARIYTGDVRFRSAPCRRILGRLGKLPSLLGTTGRGDLIGQWTVLHPDRGDRFGRADDGAIVLWAKVRGTPVLLLSDLGLAGQKALLRRTRDLRADIVVAGLPAAGEPLSDELLEVIRPRLIVIADSEFPLSERAGQKLEDRLGRTGLPVLYTRAAGAVTFDFHNRYWELRTAKGIRLDGRRTDLKATIENALPILSSEVGTRQPGNAADPLPDDGRDDG